MMCSASLAGGRSWIAGQSRRPVYDPGNTCAWRGGGREGAGKHGEGGHPFPLSKNYVANSPHSSTAVVLSVFAASAPSHLPLPPCMPPPATPPFLVNATSTCKAVRARKFILSLVEFEGVQDAIVDAGGWGNVETWASALKK